MTDDLVFTLITDVSGIIGKISTKPKSNRGGVRAGSGKPPTLPPGTKQWTTRVTVNEREILKETLQTLRKNDSKPL